MAGSTNDPKRQAGKVFTLLVLLVLTPLAGGIAFFTVCFGTAVAGVDDEWAWGLGIVAALAAAAAVLGIVYRLSKRIP